MNVRRYPMEKWHHTTVVAVRKGDTVVVGSDGQVTLNNTVLKQGAAKVRLYDRLFPLAAFLNEHRLFVDSV